MGKVHLPWDMAALVDGEKVYYCSGTEISNTMYWRSGDVKGHQKTTGIERFKATATSITAL